jgi:hypothetical protein
VIPLPFLWAQAPPLSAGQSLLRWVLVFGEPSVTINGPLGGVLTWAKVVGLFCLLGWIGSRLIAAYKSAAMPRNRPLDIAALIALAGGFLCALLQVLDQTGRLKLGKFAGFSAIEALSIVFAGMLVVWVEYRLWTGLRRLGNRGDLALLAAMHVALLLGIGSAVAFKNTDPDLYRQIGWTEGLRIGATYMGLTVLVWVVLSMIDELISIRPRRLYSIAWQAWIESFRRMGAPWVVLVVFAVILLFFDWFVSSRTAEMGRSYVGSLMFLAAVLMMLMVAILSPISLPNDIRQQTIYTIVSKPVRRLELIWGRLIGYMALVTVLLAIFGAVSIVYLERNIGGEIRKAQADAERMERQNKPETARLLREKVEQLQTRMSARLPVRGSLSFIDSKGLPRRKGIDVGQEMQFRSHIEGATPSKAIWQFGEGLEDPSDDRKPLGQRRRINRIISVDDFLEPGTIEYVENQMYELRYSAMEATAKQQMGAGTAKQSFAQGTAAARTNEQAEALKKDRDLLVAKEKRLLSNYQAAVAAKKTAEADALLKEAQALHSRQIPVEMTFTVYRTTKGDVGEPVLASLIAVNTLRPDAKPHTDVFPIHEYYTDKRFMPAEILVGSRGRLSIEIQCMSPNQYLGMAENDFFLLASQGSYRTNFIKGLLGVWLQAMVLTAVGVFAGTFLSWPVAFLTTIFFGIAGYVGFNFLQDFSMRLIQGGGPFESLIRMLSHDNMQSELAPTVAVVSAKTLDMLFMPILERLVYLVPNFSALDVSNTVADGFAVTPGQVLGHIMIGLGYAIPFSIAGYFILKNREVAA